MWNRCRGGPIWPGVLVGTGLVGYQLSAVTRPRRRNLDCVVRAVLSAFERAGGHLRGLGFTDSELVAGGLAVPAHRGTGTGGTGRGRWGSGVVHVLRNRLVVPLVETGAGWSGSLPAASPTPTRGCRSG